MSLGFGSRNVCTWKSGGQPLPEPDPDREHRRAPGSHSRSRRVRTAPRTAPARGASAPWPAASVSRTAVISSKKRGSSRVSVVRGCFRSTSTIAGDPAGPRRHHDDARREEDRLGDRVRDEDDRASGLLPDPQQLHVQALARHLVERAERLVHQQQRGVERQRAGDRDALLHAARELPGPARLEPGQLDELEHLGDACAAACAVPARASRAAATRCGRRCASRRARRPGRRSRSRGRAAPDARSCR